MPTRYFKIENFSDPGLSISGVSPHALREQSLGKGGDEDTSFDWEFEKEHFSSFHNLHPDETTLILPG